VNGADLLADPSAGAPDPSVALPLKPVSPSSRGVASDLLPGQVHRRRRHGAVHPRPDRHRRVTAALAVALTAILSSSCGGTATTDADTSDSARTVSAAVQRPIQAVDQLINIDGGRLHLTCTGNGTKTVLLIAGWDGGDGNWDAVRPALAEHARVCSYARFGTGTSDAPPVTQTFATQADDLHKLLTAAGEPGPYVVVGHSFGGVQAVTFTSKFLSEVDGLVLVDTSPDNWPDTVCSVPAYQPACDLMHDPASDAEKLDVFAAFKAARTITSLGATPMTVITGAHRSPQGLTPDEQARLDSLWADGAHRWAARSALSNVVTVEQTGHHIEVDQPQIVIDGVLDQLR
jgi:pimeloyl-ACP methyl ester carboxylesterase